MKKLTEKDLEILGDQSTKTLAEWHNRLNLGEWLDCFLDPSPEYYPGGFEGWKAAQPDRRGLIMDWIVEKIGRKETLRELHEGRFGRTTEEFEHWYEVDRKERRRERGEVDMVCKICGRKGEPMEFYRVLAQSEGPSGYFCPVCGSADLEEKPIPSVESSWKKINEGFTTCSPI